MAKSGSTISFAYDQNGIRTKKTVNGVTTTFSTVNGTIVGMSNGTDTLYFNWDTNSFTLNGTQYYYLNNIQGDIVAIADSTGQIVVEYTYDAWGNPLSISGSLASTVGLLAAG